MIEGIRREDMSREIQDFILLSIDFWEPFTFLVLLLWEVETGAQRRRVGNENERRTIEINKIKDIVVDEPINE